MHDSPMGPMGSGDYYSGRCIAQRKACSSCTVLMLHDMQGHAKKFDLVIKRNTFSGVRQVLTLRHCVEQR